MPDDDREPRNLSVDAGQLDLESGIRDALRLLAAPEGGADVSLNESARIAGGMFDDLDFESVDDATLETLLTRIVSSMAGLTIVGYWTLSAAATMAEIDRLDVLRAIENTHLDDDGSLRTD